MLPRHHRLTHSRDFRSALRSGSRARSGAVVAIVHRSADARPARLGLVVGRPVGNSVQRHRVSRVLRHAVRHRMPELPLGTIVILRALPEAAGSPDRLAADARRALDRAAGRL